MLALGLQALAFFGQATIRAAAILFMPMSPSALTRCWRGRNASWLDSFKIGKRAVLDPDDDRGFPGIASFDRS